MAIQKDYLKSLESMESLESFEDSMCNYAVFICFNKMDCFDFYKASQRLQESDSAFSNKTHFLQIHFKAWGFYTIRKNRYYIFANI